MNNTQTIHCNTQQYYNSFLPATVRNWNELSQEIHDSNTLLEGFPNFTISVKEMSKCITPDLEQVVVL